MYAGALLKIFEDRLGPAFQNQTGLLFKAKVKALFKLPM
jgi:hypothetical protein